MISCDVLKSYTRVFPVLGSALKCTVIAKTGLLKSSVSEATVLTPHTWHDLEQVPNVKLL